MARTFTNAFMKCRQNHVVDDEIFAILISDGSFAIHAPLMAIMLTCSNADLTARHSAAATGAYLPPMHGKSAVTLCISTAPTNATDAYTINNY